MLILIMNQSEVNKRAATALMHEKNINCFYIYPNLDKNIEKQDEIYIVDLDADGKFQKEFSTEKLISFLKEKNLLANTCNINLLISDIFVKKGMYNYALELSYNLKEKHQINASVKILNRDLDYSVAFLIPPQTPNDKWQVFGIQKIGYGSWNQLGYNHFTSHSEKKLLWEDRDISEWMNGGKRTIKDVIKLEDEPGEPPAYKPQ